MPPVRRPFFASELSRTFGVRRLPKSSSRVDLYITLTRTQSTPYPRLRIFVDPNHTKAIDHGKRRAEFLQQIETRAKVPDVYTINTYQSVANVFNDQEILRRTVWPEQSMGQRRVDLHLWHMLGAKQLIVRQLADVGGPFARQLKWVTGRGIHSMVAEEEQLRAKLPKFVKEIIQLEPEMNAANQGELWLTVRCTGNAWEQGVGGDDVKG